MNGHIRLFAQVLAAVFAMVPIGAQAAPANNLPATDILAACAAERADLPDRDRAPERKAGTTAEPKPAPNSACRAFIVDYFKEIMTPEAQARANAPIPAGALAPDSKRHVCVRLPDFVAYRDLADILIDYGRARPDSVNQTAKSLADEAYSSRFPCPQAPGR